MNELHWMWIALMVTAPPLVSALAAFPLWRHGETILGNLAGAGVIFAAGLVLMFREYFELDHRTQACLAEGLVCWPNPSAFVRYGIYSCITLVEVFALFALSLLIERKSRNRGYAPEWR